MALQLIGAFRTDTVLSGSITIMPAPSADPVPGPDWETVCYLNQDNGNLPKFLAGDKLFAIIQAEVCCNASYNSQVTSDLGLVDGTWEPSNIENWQYRPILPIGTDISVNPIHYYAINRSSGWWTVPKDIEAPCLQFRVSSCSTAATGNDTCTIKQGAFLSVGLYREAEN